MWMPQLKKPLKMIMKLIFEVICIMNIEKVTEVIKNHYRCEDREYYRNIGGSDCGGYISSIKEVPDKNTLKCCAYEVRIYEWSITTDMYGTDLGGPFDYRCDYKELVFIDRSTYVVEETQRLEGLSPEEELNELPEEPEDDLEL